MSATIARVAATCVARVFMLTAPFVAAAPVAETDADAECEAAAATLEAVAEECTAED